MANAITLNVDQLKDYVEDIQKIDERLALASGSSTAGKRALQNAIAAEQADASKNILAYLKKNLADAEDRDLVGVVTNIERFIKENFKDRMDTFLEKAHAEQAADQKQVTLSDAEQAELLEERKRLLLTYRAAKNLIVQIFGEDAVADLNIEEPKGLTGVRPGTSRGPRTLSKYQYSLNGVELQGDANSLTHIAKTLNVKVKDLKEAMAASDIDVKNPGAAFTFYFGEEDDENRAEIHAQVLSEFENDVLSPTEEEDTSEDENGEE